MSSDIDFDIEGNFDKKKYNLIFSYFYFWEGVHQAIPAILPFYFLFVFGEFDIAQLAFIGFFAHLPWSLKLIVGIANDKWGSEKWGRRFPFIIVFGTLAGATWIVMAFYLPLDKSIYSFLLVYLLIANLGMAFADTSLDGLILDVTPKDKLAKTQGYTWTMLMLGNAGAAAMGLLFYMLGIVQVVFLITGINLAISCIFTFYIKEPPIKEGVDIVGDLKRIITEKKNWKVFAWTLVTPITYVVLMAVFFYFMLITMGIINLNEATLSLGKGQTTDEFIWLNIIVSGVHGIGIVLGSLIIGRFTDKSRRSAMRLVYIIYLPIILLSNFFVGMFLGLFAQIIFGFVYGAITIVGQTIRGDIAKKNFPDLKSAYYALLISFSNLGLAIGNLILALLYGTVAPAIGNFFLFYFLVSLFCSIVLVLSFLIFRSIDPEDYEFENLQENKIEEKIELKD